MRRIEQAGRVLAIFIPAGFAPPGLTFPTRDEDTLQVGLWSYDAGKVLGLHRHTPNFRTVELTQEAVLVRKGGLIADITEDDGNPVESVELGPGDLLVVLGGAHRYRISEDNTTVFEFKTGPFVGVEADKVVMESD